MKIAKMSAFGKMKIEKMDIPTLEEGETLIKVHYVGICGSDVHIFEGKHPTAKPPMILGHEYYGEIAKFCGTPPEGFSIGEIVTAHPLTSCGSCKNCMDGRHNLCSELSIFGVHKDGCYAEYIKTASNRLVKIENHVDPLVAALAEPLAVAVHDIRRSGLRSGESVFIIGAGTIGLLLAIIAEFNGAGRIVLSEIDPQRIKISEELGFTVVNPLEDNFEEVLAKQMGKDGFDRTFEVSGTQSGCNLMTRVARAGGTIVMIGIPNKSYKVDIVSIVLRELDIKGVRIHTFNNFRDAVEIINNGKISSKLKKLISRVYPLSEAIKAFEEIHRDKSIVKALLKLS